MVRRRLSFAVFTADKSRLPDDETRPRNPFRNVWTKVAMTALSTVLFGLIIWFVQTTGSAITRSGEHQRLDSVLRLHSSTAIAVLRALQGLLTIVSSSALLGAFDIILWSLAARDHGLGYVRLLILSSATGPVGTARILCAPSLKLRDRAWALLK